jgi:hypothetical protein
MLDERDKRYRRGGRKSRFARIGRNVRGRGREKNNGTFNSKRIISTKQYDDKGNGTNSLIFPDQTKSNFPALAVVITHLIKSNEASEPEIQ